MAVAELFLAAVNALLRLPGHRYRIWVLRRLCKWSVGAGTVVERAITVTARGGVTIGDGCVINRGALLDGRGGLVVGDLVNISPDVQVLTGDHDPDSPTLKARYRPVTIGSRAWIATRALILAGSTVAEGAVVGAGAVVAGDVPPDTIVVGVPAQPLRERSRHAQQSLPAYRRWWH